MTIAEEIRKRENETYENIDYNGLQRYLDTFSKVIAIGVLALIALGVIGSTWWYEIISMILFLLTLVVIYFVRRDIKTLFLREEEDEDYK